MRAQGGDHVKTEAYTQRDDSHMKTSTGTEFCCCDPQDVWGYPEGGRGRQDPPLEAGGMAC